MEREYDPYKWGMGTFEQWFTKAVVVFQGEPDQPIWEVTDGDKSVTISTSDGYIIEESDLDFTEEEVSHVFDMLENHILDNTPSERSDIWDIDDNEHGIYGYGY